MTAINASSAEPLPPSGLMPNSFSIQSMSTPIGSDAFELEPIAAESMSTHVGLRTFLKIAQLEPHLWPALARLQDEVTVSRTKLSDAVSLRLKMLVQESAR
jgi:hypothetical protein